MSPSFREMCRYENVLIYRQLPTSFPRFAKLAKHFNENSKNFPHKKLSISKDILYICRQMYISRKERERTAERNFVSRLIWMDVSPFAKHAPISD